jgi:hypothetical protein
MAKSQAFKNRQLAIGMLSQLYIPYDEQGVADYMATDDRTEIAGNIEKLDRLGRTDRWKGAIATWAAYVRDPDNNLRWAFLQGMIYAGYGSE